jgi:formate dehydrogenase maturation protein FdhE
MIKIARPVSLNGESVKCVGCGRIDDVYSVSVGKDDSRYTTINLCPSCRKQLSNMLTKRVK